MELITLRTIKHVALFELSGDADVGVVAICCRLRCLVKQLERGEASVVDLKKNLEYAASVLESLYIEETRQGTLSSALILPNHIKTCTV